MTDPEHVEAAAALRGQFRTATAAPAANDLHRDLADYDRAFGLLGDGQVA